MHRDAATVSRCSHAADSRNPNKKGKQETKKDEDEHERERHGDGGGVLDDEDA
jgi:hypothetical protein